MLATGLAQKLEQLGALRVREYIVLTAPIGSSQIRVHNEGDRHLQLAEQLVRLARYQVPVHGPVALFFREDPPEPKLQLVDLHAACCAWTFRSRLEPMLGSGEGEGSWL